MTLRILFFVVLLAIGYALSRADELTLTLRTTSLNGVFTTGSAGGSTKRLTTPNGSTFTQPDGTTLTAP